MTFSQKVVEAAAEAMKQRRRDEIERGRERASYEQMAELALTAALAVDGVALQGWQDIATAPKDGTAIWLLIGGRMYIGFGEEPNWLCNRARWFASAGITRKADMDRTESMPDRIFGCHGVDVAPTHWQPLPQPPAASDREERR